MTSDSSFSLNSIERAMAILAAFDNPWELTLADLARSAGLTEPTALRYAASLTTHGFLERDATTGRYRLGLRLFELGQKALRHRDPRAVALPYMSRLRDRFEETVNLGMRHADELVLIEVLESHRSIRSGAQLGERDGWHASSLGKAVLAHLPPEDARALLEHVPRPRLTPHTVTSVEQLLDELEVVRERGFAVDELETEEDLRCVGAAILDRHGDPQYAISVAGPSNRLTADAAEMIGAALREAAEAISAELGYLAPDPVQPEEGAQP
jgi:IclR family transcriptional regulator, acetate operon repressor